MEEKTLIDFAEEWYLLQGIPIFPRCSILSLQMYQAWVNYAFDAFGKTYKHSYLDF